MKHKIFMLEDMNISVKLHISSKDYPKKLEPENYDFFIHVDTNEEDFNSKVIDALDDAAGLIKSKVEKNAEEERPYKFKIKKYGVYIRDEEKEMINLDFLYDVILSLIDEVEAYIKENISSELHDDNNSETEEDNQTYQNKSVQQDDDNEEEKDNFINLNGQMILGIRLDSKKDQQKSTSDHDSQEDNDDKWNTTVMDLNGQKVIGFQHGSSKNEPKKKLNLPELHSEEDEVPEFPIDEPEDVRRSSMKISKVSLNDTESEDAQGENILNMLLNESKQDKK